MILYGISNCDTVRKARRFLEQENIEFSFHDFRKDGLTAEHIEAWLQQVDVNTLINKRSTTWKQLDEANREKVLAGDIIDICIANPTLIKRPVLSQQDKVIVGFSEKTYQEWLGQ